MKEWDQEKLEQYFDTTELLRQIEELSHAEKKENKTKNESKHGKDEEKNVCRSHF